MTNELVEDIDFTYVLDEHIDEPVVPIKVLTGDYKDTIYSYGKVKFDERPSGEVYLTFVYNVVESPLNKTELENDMKFKNHIGDILVSILSKASQEGFNNEDGTDYIEESGIQ